MNILIRMGFSLMMLFTLLGCSNVEEDTSKSTSNNIITKSNNREEPPAIKLKIGKDEIITYRGIYSWSYFDKSTGQVVTVEADHAPPTEMVNIEQGVKANIAETVKLDFEKEPTQYEIKVWDNNNVVATYNTFEEIKEKGKYIVEIVGTWEGSTATYVTALDIQ
ncbi:hypothetical protein [Solibacillus isronensis]|uniref:hypothetical protein n=1 Tax=Solibacillus isronensis TaxID=412383 RepID=UPI002041A053|nr:hypothetical protein [Solibacillus isronensis]MCM3721169.1 hypothetical protein [Solibacillus isronensis]